MTAGPAVAVAAPGGQPDLDPGGDAVTDNPPGPDDRGVASWRALGTYVQLQVAPPHLVEPARRLAARVLDDVDATCSRFRADSDLSRANARAGQWTAVSPVLAGAVVVARRAARVTDGVVDPTLGRWLVAAGYDRTFAELRDGADPVALPTPDGETWRDIGVVLEPTRSAVRVPTGVALDLGATGKAYAADLVAEAVTAAGALPGDVRIVVSVGGDVRCAERLSRSGSDDAGWRGWPIRLAATADELSNGPEPHPDGQDTGELRLLAGGVATSSVAARRWSRAGRDWHHLLDPRSGAPVTGPWRYVSARGRSCVAANTASTAAIVHGATAPSWLDRHGVAARLVGHDGSIVLTGGWPGIPRRPS